MFIGQKSDENVWKGKNSPAMVHSEQEDVFKVLTILKEVSRDQDEKPSRRGLLHSEIINGH